MCNNNFFGNGSCGWVLILIIILCCCGGNGGCGCGGNNGPDSRAGEGGM